MSTHTHRVAAIWLCAALAGAAPAGAARCAEDEQPAQTQVLGKLPVQLYEPEQFGGSPVFTSVVQGRDGIVYGAWQAGITEFDGARWRLIELRCAPLALAADEQGGVYVGCQGDFGRLVPDGVGGLRFESLQHLLPPVVGALAPATPRFSADAGTKVPTTLPPAERNCGDIKRVAAVDGGVFFLAPEVLLHLSGSAAGSGQRLTLRSHRLPARANGLSAVDGRVIVGVGGDSHRLLEFRHGALEPLAGSESIQGYVIDVAAYDRDRLIIATHAHGMYLYGPERRASPFATSAGRNAQRLRVWRLLRLDSGEFAMATHTAGLWIFDREGEITRVLDRFNDLPSNQVNELEVDAVQPALWLATGHGLVRVNVASPVQLFDLDLGLKDVAQALAVFHGRLYVGTTDALYALEPSLAQGRLSRFAAVDVHEGDRQALLVVGDELLVGGGGFGGLDVVSGENEIQRLDVPGYLLELVKSHTGDVVYAPSAYEGVQLLAKRGGQWTDLGSIPGTSQRVEKIAEAPHRRRLWLSVRSADGGFRLERVDWESNPETAPDESANPRLDAKRVAVRTYGKEQGLPSRWKLLPFYWREELYVSSPDGVFQFIEDDDRFVVSSKFNDGQPASPRAALQHGYLLASVDDDQTLWFSSARHGLARQGPSDAAPCATLAMGWLPRSHVCGLFSQQDGFVWAATSDGTLIRYDASITPESRPLSVPLLRAVRSPQGKALRCGNSLAAGATPSIPYSTGALNIEYALPRFAYGNLIRYRYRLAGLSDEWSEWTSETHHQFTALREGQYRFEVSARDERMRVSPVASYSFVVEPPWYRTWWAYLSYAALGALAIVGWVRLRVHRARRRIATLETEVANRTQALRESETAVRRARDELEQRVEARTAELREREERFRTLCEHAPVGILLSGAAGNCTYVNPLCCELLGRTADECLGSDWSSAIHCEDRDAVHAAWTKAVAATAAMSHEFRIRRPDGGFKHVLFHAVPRVDASGEVVGWIGTLLDLTDRRRAEETLDEQKSMLAHVARLSTMGEFVAEIAHEVNQPLHSIVNYAEASSNVLASGNGNLSKLCDWNRSIVESARRAGEIIKRLRRFVSRSESRRTAVDVNELVRDSVELVAFEARRRLASVDTDLSAGLPPALIDRVQIQQVVVNLLKNAYEAMEENGAAPRRVRIKTYQDNRELRIAIADCGPGIRVTDQDIFAAFVTTKPSGMGMGLAISKTIVDAHGGRLWAESSHSGAAFHIALPTAEQIASEASELEGE